MKKWHTLSGKKQLSWWFALLALLCWLPAALTETGTVFPWRDYVLDVTLATSDPALVNADATPVKGTFVLVEVTTLAQDMATTDIEQYCGDFSLRDGDGAEHTLYSWRVRGVTIVDGEFGVAPQQKVLELIFIMEGKEATAFEDAKLLIATEREGERVVVSLSKAPSVRADSTTENADITPAVENERNETTEAPTVTPTAENQPTSTPEPAIDVIHSSLETLLAQCQETAQTP